MSCDILSIILIVNFRGKVGFIPALLINQYLYEQGQYIQAGDH